MDFPRPRFARAGASPEEIDALEQAFDSEPEAAQASYLEQLAGTSDYDIAQELAKLRQPAVEEPETLQGVTDPPAGDTPPGALTVVVEVGADGEGWTELEGTAPSAVNDLQIASGDGTVSVTAVSGDPASACINVEGATPDTEATVSYLLAG